MDAASPAATAGILPGDEITAIDGKAYTSWEDAQFHILLSPDRALGLRVKRGGEERDVALRSESVTQERVGSIGVYPLVRVGQVVPKQPAAEAGLKTDDAILKIGDTPIRNFAEIPDLVRASAGKPLLLKVWREGEVLEVSVTPRDEGSGVKIGIDRKTVLKKFGPIEAVRESLRWTGEMTRQTFDVLGRLLTARISPKTMMGPLGIAKASGDAARGGLASLLFLVAVISLQVGILNLFPLAPPRRRAPRHPGRRGPSEARLQPHRRRLDHERGGGGDLPADRPRALLGPQQDEPIEPVPALGDLMSGVRTHEIS